MSSIRRLSSSVDRKAGLAALLMIACCPWALARQPDIDPVDEPAVDADPRLEEVVDQAPRLNRYRVIERRGDFPVLEAETDVAARRARAKIRGPSPDSGTEVDVAVVDGRAYGRRILREKLPGEPLRDLAEPWLALRIESVPPIHGKDHLYARYTALLRNATVLREQPPRGGDSRLRFTVRPALGAYLRFAEPLLAALRRDDDPERREEAVAAARSRLHGDWATGRVSFTVTIDASEHRLLRIADPEVDWSLRFMGRDGDERPIEIPPQLPADDPSEATPLAALLAGQGREAGFGKTTR